MPIHLLSVLHAPKSVIRKVHGLFATFFWGSQDGKGKRKWQAWKNMCVPMEKGGSGVRDLTEVQRSLFMKFGWQLVNQNSLWARFFHKKYVKLGHIVLSMTTGLGCRFGRVFWNAFQIY